MLVTKIWQGKYYTTIARLLEANKKGIVNFEERDGLKYFSYPNGNLIHCTATFHKYLVQLK